MNSPHISFPSAQPELRLKRAVEKAGENQSNLRQNDVRLATAWDKLHRARALLEAEQGLLCHERDALEHARMTLQRRETVLAEREQALTAALSEAARKQAEATKPKPLFGFTRAPFGFGKASGA